MPRRFIPEGEGKRVPVMTRTTTELRSQIEQAAAKSGRSLAQEVERRLEQSFEPNALVKTLLLEVLYQIQQAIKANKGKEIDLNFWISLTEAVATAEREVNQRQFLDPERTKDVARGFDAMFNYAPRADHQESAVDELVVEDTPKPG